ncbi:unnamed protein product [Rotaria socialis]
MTLEKATASIVPLVSGIIDYVVLVKQYCNRYSPILTRDESAPIYLYSMQTEFFSSLNKALRDQKRHLLKPWFPYLKLFLNARERLPFYYDTVWRGVSGDFDASCLHNDLQTWWSVNSCSKAFNVIEAFVGGKGVVFAIKVSHGKDISASMAMKDEQEVILKPGMGATVFMKNKPLDFDSPHVGKTGVKLTVYRDFTAGPELEGELLTKTSERIVKKITLEALTNITGHSRRYMQTMPNSTQDSAMMVCYRESLSNLEKFHGDEEQKILNFINNIERIGKMISAPDEILLCMCTAKLDGEAKRWYEDNMSLTHWENLKSSLLERFTTSDSSSKIFEQLKERKQKLDETITSYYDAVIKLCREYDSTMSQKMMISWLQNGIKDSLKTHIKRQMKLLPESARTTQAFLKIAKDEQELQEENSTEQESSQPYLPFITNTISKTPQKIQSNSDRTTTSQYLPSRQATYEHTKQNSPSSTNYNSTRSKSDGCDFYSQQRSNPRQQESRHTVTYNKRREQQQQPNRQPSHPSTQSDTQQRPLNNKQHEAIIDTGSAGTIINHQLLKKIYHKNFIYKNKLHKSANCSSINIIGEIELEIKIQGHKTYILADVATNLITDLLLGNDWIYPNNVMIDSPQQHIFLMNENRKVIVSTPFVKPKQLRLPVLLTEEITLPPKSEKCINIKILSSMNQTPEALFEPTRHLHSKAIFLINALVKVEENRSRIMIINANDRQKTLSKNTTLGHISYRSEANNYLILPEVSQGNNKRLMSTKIFSRKRDSHLPDRSCVLTTHRKVPSVGLACRMNNHDVEQLQCYVCQEQFLSRNDLQQHLRQKCYPSEIRTQIEQITQHIEDAEQREKLQQILWKHGKLFDLRQPSIIKATIHHAIETGAHPPIYTSPYRVSYKDEQIQREEIDKLFKQGVIEESTSPWSSPIVLVRKKDGSVRFCIGYFQVGLDPKDRPKTAFSTRDQHYQFTVLPQGVTNGPPAFQRIVSQILGPTRWKYSLAYLDDVIIYSTTFKEHLIHLNDILNRLNYANFRLNVTKCQIARTSIDYLGHHIEHRSIRPNADNIRALLETQQPTSAKEAFRFVKAAEYYRKFIPGFSTITQPLHQYAPTTKEQRTKKSQATPITLSDDAIDAFNKLKRILTNDLVLRIPDQNLPFKIQTDASKIGVGAVLVQTHPNGDLPVAYLSKKFTTTQMNWPATEQECYAIIYAIEKWHKYLDGQSFSIETDHKPLLPLNSKQQLNSKCKHNIVADYLSRSPVDDGSNDEDDYTPTRSASTQTDDYMKTKIVAPVITRNYAKQQVAERSDLHSVDRTCEMDTRKRNVDIEVVQSCDTHYNQCHTPVVTNEMQQIIPFTWEQLKEAQHQDEEIKNIINNIQNHKKYFIKDSMLMKKACPPAQVIPKGRIRSDIMKIYHDTPANGAHFGRDRTINKIQQRYFWAGMISDIRNFTSNVHRHRKSIHWALD